MTVEELEVFWAEVLSGEPARTRRVLDRLEAASRQAVLEHLRRMTSEPGWTEGQQDRARAALQAVSSSPPHSGAKSDPLEN